MRVVSLPNLRGMSRYMQRQKAALFARLAAFIVEDNTSRIRKRIAYDGHPQKANAASTIRRKGHDIPLLDQGILENAALYRIGVARLGVHVVIDVPPERRKVIGYLRAKGYRYWGVSTAARRFAQKELGLLWENAKDRL